MLEENVEAIKSIVALMRINNNWDWWKGLRKKDSQQIRRTNVEIEDGLEWMENVGKKR